MLKINIVCAELVILCVVNESCVVIKPASSDVEIMRLRIRLSFVSVLW